MTATGPDVTGPDLGSHAQTGPDWTDDWTAVQTDDRTDDRTGEMTDEELVRLVQEWTDREGKVPGRTAVMKEYRIGAGRADRARSNVKAPGKLRRVK